MSEPKIVTLPFSVAEPNRIVTYTCPYWDIVDPPTPEQRENTKDSITVRGIKTPVVVCEVLLDDWLVVDGYNRLSIAAELGLCADDVPLHNLGEDQGYEDEELEAMAKSLNEDRRQLSEAYQAKQREARRLRIKEKAEAGMSQRAIAAEEKVSRAQVRLDLATGHPCPVELPEKSKGVDGREYDRAKLPKKEERPKPEQPSLLIKGPTRDQSVFDEAEKKAKEKADPGEMDRIWDDALAAREESSRARGEAMAPKKCTWYACTDPIIGQSDGKGYCLAHLARAQQVLETMPKVSLDAVASLGASEKAAETTPYVAPKEDRAEASASAPRTTNGGGFQHYNTPPLLIEPIRKIGPIKLDPCHNSGSMLEAEHTIDEQQNGLSNGALSWEAMAGGWGLVVVNPPYNNIEPWADRCILEAARGAQVILIVPARNWSSWWQKVARSCEVLCPIGERVRFYKNGEPDGNPIEPTVVFYWGRQPGRFCAAFEKLGVPLRLIPADMYSQASEWLRKEALDARQAELPQEAAPPQLPAAPQEEPSPWLEKGLADLKKTSTAEECDEVAKQLLSKAATQEESQTVAAAAIEQRSRLPHAENGRSPRQEKGVRLVEVWSRDGTPVRKGGYQIATIPLQVRLKGDAQQAEWQRDERLWVRAAGWLDGVLEQFAAAKDRAASLKIFDEFSPGVATFSERETVSRAHQAALKRLSDAEVAQRFDKPQKGAKGPQCKHRQGSKQCKNTALSPSKFCISHLKKVEGKKGLVGR